MKFTSIAAAAALSLLSSISQAGVIYEWVTVSNAMPMRDPVIRVELDEAVVRSGSFQLAIAPGTQAIPDTGLKLYHYQDSWVPGRWFPIQSDYLYMDLSFVHNNFYMVGAIRSQDFSSELDTSTGRGADPRLWTINRTNGDGILGCSFSEQRYCSGATGYFRQVPEPAPLALLGLGALGALGALAARRRKART